MENGARDGVRQACGMECLHRLQLLPRPSSSYRQRLQRRPDVELPRLLQPPQQAQDVNIEAEHLWHASCLNGANVVAIHFHGGAAAGVGFDY